MTPHPALDALRPPEGVTPGPWEAGRRGVFGDRTKFTRLDECAWVTGLANDADRAHIANMDPDTTKVLLDVVGRLLTALDVLGGQAGVAAHLARQEHAEALALLDSITPRDKEADRG